MMRCIAEMLESEWPAHQLPRALLPSIISYINVPVTPFALYSTLSSSMGSSLQSKLLIMADKSKNKTKDGSSPKRQRSQSFTPSPSLPNEGVSSSTSMAPTSLLDDMVTAATHNKGMIAIGQSLSDEAVAPLSLLSITLQHISALDTIPLPCEDDDF
jgi:hypothetical protein